MLHTYTKTGQRASWETSRLSLLPRPAIASQAACLCCQLPAVSAAVTYPQHVVELLSITTKSHFIDHAFKGVQLRAAVALLAFHFKLHLAASLGLLALVMIIFPHLQVRNQYNIQCDALHRLCNTLMQVPCRSLLS